MLATARAFIDGRALIGEGEPTGVPFDRDDAPQLARDLDALAGSMKIARPDRIVFSAELALRVYTEAGWFGRKRHATLAIGWPLLHLLDADELRAAVALALAGEVVRMGTTPPMAHDERVAGRVGRPLLARTLTRLLVSETIAAQSWWDDWNIKARLDKRVPADALDQLRQKLENRGRGDWQAALDRRLVGDSDGGRLAALGGADLGGGSHRCAAAALLWDGLVARVWTALEMPFVALLEPVWQACFEAHAAHRQRVRELDAMRRAGQLDITGQIDLAESMESLAGARAAYPLYREAYARERRPELALALARTMIAIDPDRAREALARIAASPLAVAPAARQLLAGMLSGNTPLADRDVHRPLP
jgi:hypothetical protein